MPYPTEHAARQRDPADFESDTLRRFVPDGWPQGLAAIGGQLRNAKDDAIVIQTVRAKADAWTVGEFRAWLDDHDLATTIEAASEDRADESVSPERVRRFDKMTLRRRPRRDEKTGFLRVDAALTRAPAVFVYRRPDGGTRREYRPAEHVFSRRNLDSIRGAIGTNDHPPVRVTRKNVRRYQIGQIEGEPIVRGDVVEAGILVTDEEALAEMERGKTQISLGYDCDLVVEPGVWIDDDGNRHPYDAIQTNHETNHWALVHEGRAGPEIRAYLDHNDAAQVAAEDQHMPSENNDKGGARQDDLFGRSDTAHVTIDGVGYDLPLAAARAIADRLAKHDTELAEVRANADKLEAERDAIAKERDDAKAAAEQATDAEALRAKVDARLALERKAASHFDAADWEERRKLDDEALMRAVVEKVHGITLDGKSSEYVAAAFDLVQEQDERRDDLDDVSRRVTKAHGGDGNERAQVAERITKAMRFDESAWARPIPGGATSAGPTRQEYQS